jgi:hypothetical protein
MAGTDQQLARISAVQEKYAEMLMGKKHVIGVSIGTTGENGKETGRYALVVMVDEKLPLDELAPEDRIPSELDGVPVLVHEVGVVEAQ